MKKMCADLAEEQHELDAFVSDLDEAAWNTQMPAEGWTIKDQIRHLAYYEERARLAASAPEFFKRWLADIQQDPDRYQKHIYETGKDLSAKETYKNCSKIERKFKMQQLYKKLVSTPGDTAL